MVFYFSTDIECKKFYSEEVQLKFKEMYDLYGYHLKDIRV